MWKYKTGEQVKIGDHVLTSKRWADRENDGDRSGVVVGDRGFVSVRVEDGSSIDFDMRSLTLVRRGGES